jgi:uncharacterized membrane protein
MRLWLVPMIYTGASVVCGLAVPRIEQAYFAAYTLKLSVASTQAYLSAAASGMMALTGVVFALAFVTVQFSAIAYSPRLVLWFGRDHLLFHALGVFVATFIYALFTLAWVDRAGSGTVPLFSCLLVASLLILSMLLFALLIQRLTDLQVTNVLATVGDKGRAVIRDIFETVEKAPHLEWREQSPGAIPLAPTTRSLIYSGEPQAIAKFDIGALVRCAKRDDAVLEMMCGVGDTLIEGTVVLHIHGAQDRVAEKELLEAIHLKSERTFEQDPKYPIRLLVDIAIRALSPAINDPTTAVQALDQIEDLLRRLARYELHSIHAADADGKLRLIIPMPTWEDYLSLAFDEIRQFGAGSIQVIRRLRAALNGLAETTMLPAHVEAVKRYIDHLNVAIEHSPLDAQDRTLALQADRQGLGLSRRGV